jgi:sugar phosphate isomerase/epimerase
MSPAADGTVVVLGSYWTLACGADPAGDQQCPHDFRQRVEAAARAGFTAMGFWHTDLEVLEQTYGFAEIEKILAGSGITQIEVEWLLDWFATGERRAASDRTRSLLLEAAETLGARHIKVADLGNDGARMPQMAEEFALLCREAAERGAMVLFELLPAPLSRIPSLDQVLALVRGAGEPNGGIMLDNLHLQRTGTHPSDLINKIPRRTPLGVEINDGSLATPTRLEDSIVNRRLLPGDGEFDIEAFLHAVWTLGYEGPIGVELLNEYARKWTLDVAATEAFRKTTRVVSAARSSWTGGS